MSARSVNLVDAHERGAARERVERAVAQLEHAGDRHVIFRIGQPHLLQQHAAFDDADGEHQIARHAVAIRGHRHRLRHRPGRQRLGRRRRAGGDGEA